MGHLSRHLYCHFLSLRIFFAVYQLVAWNLSAHLSVHSEYATLALLASVPAVLATLVSANVFHSDEYILNVKVIYSKWSSNIY